LRHGIKIESSISLSVRSLSVTADVDVTVISLRHFPRSSSSNTDRPPPTDVMISHPGTYVGTRRPHLTPSCERPTYCIILL
jgi:hypothetical protein